LVLNCGVLLVIVNKQNMRCEKHKAEHRAAGRRRLK
jgi:hypothetical protein